MAQLYFRYGAMGCGKTMQLLQVAFNYEERGQKVCVRLQTQKMELNF